MPYNNNVPQPNQTISSTTTPINNNFAFIQTDAQLNHVFNGNVGGVAEGAHKYTDMPATTAPGAGTLPSGCIGRYFVVSTPNGGRPFFADNVSANAFSFTITNVPNGVLNGSVALTTSYANVVAFLPNTCGSFYIFSPANPNAFATGNYFAYAGTVNLINPNDQDVDMDTQTVGLNLQARVQHSGDAGTYKYVITYTQP